MARRELRRKITATVLTVTALCCLLGVCAWLLLGSNVFSDTIRIMMLVCTVVLGVATIGLLVAKVQEIRALREIIRSEDAQQQSEAETPRPELAPGCGAFALARATGYRVMHRQRNDATWAYICHEP